MGITIVTPMYNAQNTIVQMLEGLKGQTAKGFEVIVIDDGSTDKSPQLVAKFSKQSNFPIKLIRQENSGPAKARNLGVKHSNGEIIIFLDSDCIPPPNWVEAMSSPLKGSIVGCNCGYKTKNDSKLIARYIGYEIAKRHEKMIGKNVDTMGSYSASFVRDVFEATGGFDIEYTAASAEDFDLAFKVRSMGYNLLFTGETFVYHYHPDSLKKYLRQQYIRGYWRVKMYLKNLTKLMEGDSYTGHEAQFQFIFSSLALLSLALVVFNLYLPLVGFGILFLSNMPLGLWASRKERKFLIIAPVLASLRSLAGTIGVFAYLIKNFPSWLKETR